MKKPEGRASQCGKNLTRRKKAQNENEVESMRENKKRKKGRSREQRDEFRRGEDRPEGFCAIKNKN
jgi:hypothetical protein